MASSTPMETKLSNVRLSTAVPSKITPENTVHHLTNTDLAMKLHYLKGVYFFNKEAVEGLTISELKAAMFRLLSFHYRVAGRIRMLPENGRPFIKCNDSGVRIMEAEANATVNEWMERKWDVSELAYSSHVLGPDLEFSPFVFLQFTWFKCGGFSVGLSWAHIIGDVFSASTFINMLGQILKGKMPSQIPSLVDKSNTKVQNPIPPFPKKPSSLKSVDLVGNHWLNSSNTEMATLSFYISPKNLDQITSKTDAKPFQALSAIIWKSLANVRGDLETRIVTICASNSQDKIASEGNGQSISTIAADFIVSKASVMDLAELVTKKTMDENNLIEEFMERENKNLDVILYGANLTFVNLEGANIYELELKGHKPFFANYTMEGIGDKGVVLVLQGFEIYGGRLVTIILPSDQVVDLKNELKKEWDFEHDEVTLTNGKAMDR